MEREGNPCSLLVGMYIGAASVEISKVVPQKIKNRTTIWSSNSFSGFYLKKRRILIQKDICSPVFTGALFTVAKTRKNPKCPPTDEQMKKWSIKKVVYTAEYDLAPQKNKILSFVTTWMDLENIMLRKINQTAKKIQVEIWITQRLRVPTFWQ